MFGQSWTAKTSVELAVGSSDVHLSVWADCRGAWGNLTWPEHPGSGDYLSELPANAVLFEDRLEGSAASWELKGLWHRAQNSSCVALPAESGNGALYFGNEGYCDFYNRQSCYQGVGWATTPPIAGVKKGAKLSFDSYRDLGAYDATWVEFFLAGRGTSAASDDRPRVWIQRDVQPTDKSWQHVEVELPYAWFYGMPVQIRFVADTRSGWEKRDHKGWVVDNVRLSL